MKLAAIPPTFAMRCPNVLIRKKYCEEGSMGGLTVIKCFREHRTLKTRGLDNTNFWRGHP